MTAEIMATYQIDRKPEVYWKKVHERIACSKALDVVIAYAHGDESIGGNQARMALDLVRLATPQMQAIAISNSSEKPASLGDIEAMLTVAGIDPQSILTKDNVLTEEKSLVNHDVIEGAPTRE